jgi:hypothetical protein
MLGVFLAANRRKNGSIYWESSQHRRDALNKEAACAIIGAKKLNAYAITND